MKKIIFIFITLFLVQFIYIGNGISLSKEMFKLEEETRKLQRENSILEKEIAVISSYSQIQELVKGSDPSMLSFSLKNDAREISLVR